jgi:hypothetical protein
LVTLCPTPFSCSIPSADTVLRTFHCSPVSAPVTFRTRKRLFKKDVITCSLFKNQNRTDFIYPTRGLYRFPYFYVFVYVLIISRTSHELLFNLSHNLYRLFVIFNLVFPQFVFLQITFYPLNIYNFFLNNLYCFIIIRYNNNLISTLDFRESPLNKSNYWSRYHMIH